MLAAFTDSGRKHTELGIGSEPISALHSDLAFPSHSENAHDDHIMKRATETDVLIIGAGPTGLHLACQLLRYGIDFVVIDKNAEVTPYSKAIGVHARTLEILDQIGLAKEAVDRGTIATRARLLIDGELRGELDFSDIGRDLSPFPFVLMLEQSKTELLLYEYLQRHESHVLWRTELQNLSQHADGVVAQLNTFDSDT